MALAECRGCGAGILWITMESGKYMPVDPEPIEAWVVMSWQEAGFPHPPRQLSLVTESGKMQHGYEASAITPGSFQIEGRVPHWANCNKRKDFRRK